MEKKESKIFGIPFVLLFFIIALAALIDGFSWFFIYRPLSRQISNAQSLRRINYIPVSPTTQINPTASPSATPTQASRGGLVLPKNVVTTTPTTPTK